jgi:hypothetical protein
MAGMLLPASAQITLEITHQQDQFLSGEAIPLAVRITNRSGQDLLLGSDEDWLTFTVESLETGRGIVQKLDEVPVQGEFTLPPSKTAIKRVDIEPYFNISRPARYSVTAVLRIPGWDREVVSSPKSFYVLEGTRMWEREVGVPGAGPGGIPETRRYTLQQANYLRGQMKLYLRVTDGPGANLIKVQPIGRILSFSRPEPQVDRHSNLHLIYQSGPIAFTYLMFNPEGDVLKREAYDYVNTRPRLRVDDDGNIVVIGGVRRQSTDEMPAPMAAPEQSSEPLTNLPPAAVTNR